jgi:hypothetical protein
MKQGMREETFCCCYSSFCHWFYYYYDVTYVKNDDEERTQTYFLCCSTRRSSRDTRIHTLIQGRNCEQKCVVLASHKFRVGLHVTEIVTQSFFFKHGFPVCDSNSGVARNYGNHLEAITRAESVCLAGEEEDGWMESRSG